MTLELLDNLVRINNQPGCEKPRCNNALTVNTKSGFSTGTTKNSYELRQPKNTNTSDTR